MEDSEMERLLRQDEEIASEVAENAEQRRLEGMLKGESPLAVVDDRPLGTQLTQFVRENHGVLVAYDTLRRVYYCRYGTCGGTALLPSRVIHSADCLVGRAINGV